MIIAIQFKKTKQTHFLCCAGLSGAPTRYSPSLRANSFPGNAGNNDHQCVWQIAQWRSKMLIVRHTSDNFKSVIG